jgi:hypothetical protein
MEVSVIDTREKEIEAKVIDIKAKADAIAVVDQASYDAAQALNKAAYDEKKAFHVWFDPIDDASKKSRQAVIAQGKKIDEPLDYVIKATGSKAATWMRQEQARIADEKRKAEEAARKIAEEEAIAAAEKLAAEGMTAAADAVLAAPVVTPKIVIEQPTKAEGVSYRETFSAEVVDLMTLVKAVAEGKAPICYLAADLVALNGWARATKGTASIPGVKVVSNTIQARRS